MLYPPCKCIAVDVDGTLSWRGKVNERLITWLRKQKEDGFYIILWSARGEAHARGQVDRFNLNGLFDTIISKPGYIVDDKGWSWIRFTRIVRSFSKPINDEESQA